MERTFIENLKEKVGQSVQIAGWISVRRDQGKMVFFDFRDMTGVVQGVVLPKSAAIEIAKEASRESAVYAEGVVNQRPEKNVNIGVQNGDIELEVQALEIVSKPKELPFDFDAELNIDTYLDNLPYTLRSQRARDIFKVQATIVETFRSTLRGQKFTEFQAPALVGGDAEGGAAAFAVDYYYDQKAFLATSPQFYKQIMIGVFERVFGTPKVFRGEKSSTTRHLSEYSSLDFEMAFIKDHRDIMVVLEKTMKEIVSKVAEKHSDVMARLGTEVPLIPEHIPVLKLREAQEIIEKEFGGKAIGEPDLEPEHERQLCEWSKKTHGSDFLFVTHYPVSKRPFYTYEDEEYLGFTKSFDLLFRGLEITTGGQRINDYDVLVGRMKDRGLDPEKFSYYLQAFKVGMPPHGGIGMGLERVTARMLGLHNVKEAALFPRDMNRIDTLLSSGENK